MRKIEAKSSASVTFSIKLILTPEEASALDAIVGYGSEPFLKVFYEHMGKSYLQPYERDMISLFKTIKENIPNEISKIKTAKEAINNALKDF